MLPKSADKKGVCKALSSAHLLFGMRLSYKVSFLKGALVLLQPKFALPPMRAAISRASSSISEQHSRMHSQPHLSSLTLRHDNEDGTARSVSPVSLNGQEFAIRKSPYPKLLRQCRWYLCPAYRDSCWQVSFCRVRVIALSTAQLFHRNLLLPLIYLSVSSRQFYTLAVLFLICSCWTLCFPFLCVHSSSNTSTFQRSWSFLSRIPFLFLSGAQASFWSSGIFLEMKQAQFQQHCPWLGIFKRTEKKNYLPLHKMGSW